MASSHGESAGDGDGGGTSPPPRPPPALNLPGGGLTVSIPVARADAGGSARTPFARTPTFLRPLEDGEHETLSSLYKGVVQIFCSRCANDWERPWTKGPPRCATGTGFIIDVALRLIVTNAHVVTDAKTLQVRKEGDFDKVEASVLAVSHQVDLALCTVADDAFWAGAAALPLGETPRVQAHVDVLGYPMGGEGISITSGVVSRVDWGEYTHSQESNYVVQVDAAINGGNSGGPAVSGGRVVGVAFQGMNHAQNIGYIIPATILHVFLKDFAANGGALKGFAGLPLETQELENPAMRAWLGVPAGTSGVYVRAAAAISGLKGRVLERDVIVRVDGHAVSNDGRVQYGKGSPVDFRVYVTTKLAGEPLALSLLRGGAVVELTVPAERAVDIFPRTWFRDAEYVLFGGLVLVPMATGTKNTAFHTRVNHEVEGRKHEHPEQHVVGLSQILPHSVNLCVRAAAVVPTRCGARAEERGPQPTPTTHTHALAHTHSGATRSTVSTRSRCSRWMGLTCTAWATCCSPRKRRRAPLSCLVSAGGRSWCCSWTPRARPTQS